MRTLIEFKPISVPTRFMMSVVVLVLSEKSIKGSKQFCFSYLQAFYFSRDDVALPGFAHFFKENSKEEREHADKLLSFQNKRGGRIFLQDIKVG